MPLVFPLRVNITASMMSLFFFNCWRYFVMFMTSDLMEVGVQKQPMMIGVTIFYPPFFSFFLSFFVDTNKQRSTWAYFPASPLIFWLSGIQWSPSQPHPSVAFKFDQTERKWLLWDCLIDGATECVESFHDGISNTTAPLTGFTASRARRLHQEIPYIYVK